MNKSQTVNSGISNLTPIGGGRRAAAEQHGIEVREEPLGSIQAQLLFRMRCECGRAWFDVQLRKIAECPACGKLGVVAR